MSASWSLKIEYCLNDWNNLWKHLTECSCATTTKSCYQLCNLVFILKWQLSYSFWENVKCNQNTSISNFSLVHFRGKLIFLLPHLSFYLQIWLYCLKEHIWRRKCYALIENINSEDWNKSIWIVWISTIQSHSDWNLCYWMAKFLICF